MGWYDWFARFYDRSLEHHYLDTRAAALEALAPRRGNVLLDLPCGTGQSFDTLAPALGPDGCLVGVDLSAGMLAKAQSRVDARKDEVWAEVVLHQSDVQALDAARVAELTGGRPLDRIQVFLGMTAFPDHVAAFEHLWGLLAPGGRFVIVDVHDAKPGFQGKMVNLVARAKIQRRVWEPLERVALGYEFVELPSKKEHGGQLFFAVGNKPA